MMPPRRLAVWLLLTPAWAAAVEPNVDQLNALKPLHGLVGQWKGTGTSETSAGWTETTEVLWGFREQDGRVSLNFYIDAGEFLTEAVITFVPADGKYRFIARDKKQQIIRFTGDPEGSQTLRFQRDDENPADKIDRIEVKLVREGDKAVIAYYRRKGKANYEALAQVEMFRQDQPLEEFKDGPRCPITGGAGRVPVDVNGRTVHVACDHCAAELLQRPEKYLTK